MRYLHLLYKQARNLFCGFRFGHGYDLQTTGKPFDVDQPGKDSYRHRHAGCTEVLVTSSKRWVLMHELRGAPEPEFSKILNQISPCDLLLVEGFKREKLPKLEVYRASVGESPLHPQDADIVAVASDGKVDTKLPQFDLNDAPSIASFILKHTRVV